MPRFKLNLDDLLGAILLVAILIGGYFLLHALS